MAHFAQAKEMAFGHSTIRMVSLKKKENMKIQLKRESGKSIGTMADYSEKADKFKYVNFRCYAVNYNIFVITSGMGGMLYK